MSASTPAGDDRPPAHPIGESAEHRREDRSEQQAEKGAGEGARQRNPSRGGDEVRQEDEEDVERQAHCRDDTEANGHLARRRAQCLTQRGVARYRSPTLDGTEVRCLLESEPNVEPDQPERQRQQERESPSPGLQCRGDNVETQERPGGEAGSEAEADGGVLPTAVPAAAIGRCVLQDERGRPALLPADRRALPGAQARVAESAPTSRLSRSPGSNPMPAVTSAMRAIPATSALCRPCLSPYDANSSAPTGRATNAIPKMAKAATRRVRSSVPGKNVAARTVANTPYRAKSYHSTKLPMQAATRTRLRIGAALAFRGPFRTACGEITAWPSRSAAAPPV